MALIKCVECGKEVSDKSEACIHCGCPMDIIVADILMTSEQVAEGNQAIPTRIDGTQVNIEEIMAASGYHKGTAITKLKEITGQDIETCKKALDKPFDEYISKNIDIKNIMEQTGYSKVKSIEILHEKTGLSLNECKALFDQPFRDMEKSYNLPSNSPVQPVAVTKYEIKRKCSSCNAIFLSDKTACPSCGSIRTIPMQQVRDSDVSEVRCPTCNSLDIQKIGGGNKVGSALLFGVLSLGHISKTFKCRHCGYKW